MNEITEATLLGSWVGECGKGFVFPPPDCYARLEAFFNEAWERDQARRNRRDLIWTEEEMKKHIDEVRATFRKANQSFLLRITEEGALVAQLEKGRTRPIIELARYIGKRDQPRGVVLMNGDGFDNTLLQQIQARLRERVRVDFPRNAQRLLVPHMALTSARLDFSSIQPIHIAGDRQTSMVVKVKKPPAAVREAERLKLGNDNENNTRRVDFEDSGIKYRAEWNWNYPAPGAGDEPFGNNPPRWSIFHRAEFSNDERWHNIVEHDDGTWTVTEQVHRLGSSVFWAAGPDGQRHRWISSFDQNETPPMYFLAQLPDKGGIRYVTHAIRLLAPEIVQKARQDGRRVFRQGDIFAVETEKTDEDFSGNRIVRRHELFNYQQTFRQWVGKELMDPGSKYEVSVKTGSELVIDEEWFNRDGGLRLAPFPGVNWSLNEDTRLNVNLRRKLMIYGTGHNASQVVVTSYGTFVKGVMYHDPILEDIRAGRRPEHAPLTLGDGQKWFLCCRNTVPRLVQDTDSVVSDNGNTGREILDEGPENRPVLAVDSGNINRLRSNSARWKTRRDHQSSPSVMGTT